jgi:hypothetical protein
VLDKIRKNTGPMLKISEKIRKNPGPILYTVVAIVSIWFFYWFGAVYH